jgi:hypothetical protein
MWSRGIHDHNQAQSQAKAQAKNINKNGAQALRRHFRRQCLRSQGNRERRRAGTLGGVY